MCGIQLVVKEVDALLKQVSPVSFQTTATLWLDRRGPDHFGSFTLRECCTLDNYSERERYATLSASVLQMRDQLVTQPLALNQEKSAYFAWNGEIYQILQDDNKEGEALAEHFFVRDVWTSNQSDTLLVADIFQKVFQESQSFDQTATVSNDKMDRTDRDQVSILKNLSAAAACLVNAEYAFCILTNDSVYFARDPLGRRSLLVRQTVDKSMSLEENHAIKGDNSNMTVDCLDCRHSWSLASVVALPSQRCCTNCNRVFTWTEVQPGIVYCYNWKTGHQQAMTIPSCRSILELSRFSNKTEKICFVTDKWPSLGESKDENDAHVTILYSLLLEAVRRRITGPTAILFSGGLDSVVLTALALEVLDPNDPPLTLVNISFVDREKNDQIQRGVDGSAKVDTIAADTQAAIASYHELLALYPNHKICFIQQQEDWSRVEQHRQHIQDLIFPKSSVMDVNIATALWFAASAVSSNVRILLTGLGADEQFGGYGRHRTAWQSGGSARLRQELDLDTSRLWERNLGRDDRVLSDSSKEARFPFLDTSVMEYTRTLKLHDVCEFSLPPGQGDKLILRQIAQRLNLHSASTAVKRAIQFGSRIAHVSDTRRFGSRRKAHGDA